MSTWSIPLGELIARARGKLGIVARKTVITAFGRVIKKTPVKTGRARAGWMCTIDTPATLTPGLAAVNDTDKSGASTIATMRETIQGWDPLTGKIAILNNNVPYIGELENGSSRQAPSGMIKITMAEMGGIAQDAAAESQGGTWGGSQSALFVGSSWDIGEAGE